MMNSKNFTNLTEKQKTAYIELKRKENELNRLKRTIEYGYSYKLRRLVHGAYVGRHTPDSDELEKIKKRITELEKELKQAE